MKIGTFGSGNMARALGGALAHVGHEVMIGSRDASKAEAIADEIGAGTRGGTNDEVAGFAEIVIHTVRSGPSTFLRSVTDLDGKIVIDINNRDFPRTIKDSPLFPSLYEQNRADVPNARLVKCFNTMAMEVFDHEPAELASFGVTAFIAGADEEARAVVARLARDIGLSPLDLGGSDNADLVEMQADFIRAAMFGHGKFLFTSQIREIPAASEPRFGGRKPGSY